MFVLDLRGTEEEEKSRVNKKIIRLDAGEKVTGRTGRLRGNGAVRLEYFGPPGTRACARIDKERVRESYRANCNTSDKVYT